MGERSKLDVRGFESPKLPKQAKYIYGFVTKNHGLYNKKSPIKSDFFAVTSFLHNHYGGRRWIRTTEVSDNRFTVCPLWPLGNSPICKAYCLNSRLILELVDGLEPPTCWLQISCSTNWATPAFSLFHKRFCFVFASLVDCSYIIPYEVPNVNTFFKFFQKKFKQTENPHKCWAFAIQYVYYCTTDKK